MHFQMCLVRKYLRMYREGRISAKTLVDALSFVLGARGLVGKGEKLDLEKAVTIAEKVEGDYFTLRGEPRVVPARIAKIADALKKKG